MQFPQQEARKTKQNLKPYWTDEQASMKKKDRKWMEIVNKIKMRLETNDKSLGAEVEDELSVQTPDTLKNNKVP